MRIRVIEADAVLAEGIGFEKNGYTVDLAADGQTGLARALDDCFALVMLDLMLPLRDEWIVCETLRRERGDLPVLIRSARGSTEERVRGLGLGADDYLVKPFDFRELLARVHALLRREHPHAPRPSASPTSRSIATTGRCAAVSRPSRHAARIFAIGGARC